jgi:hypothetical protein
MSDEEFLDAFERCVLPVHRFGHRTHIRLAFLYISREGRDRGGRRMRIGIRRYAASIGRPGLYNETLTAFWIDTVADAVARHRPLPDHRALLRCAPHLADRGLQYRHWSPEILNSDVARQRYVLPDLAPVRAA